MRHLLGEVPAFVTPLHRAAEAGRAGAVRALLAAGAMPSPGASEGLATPLHLAAGNGALDAARALLEGGADRVARERIFDAVPAEWAEQAGHAELAALLRTH